MKRIWHSAALPFAIRNVCTYGSTWAPAAAIGTVFSHGGQVLVGAEDYDSREGSIPTRRTAILEFPSMQAAKDWYECAEYQAVIHLRHEATSEGSCQILDGFVLPGA